METGQPIKIQTKKGTTHKGILTFQNPQTIFLKLESGYNIGIDRDRIENKTVLETETQKPQPPEIQQDKDLPHVHVAHTGGTIASKIDYTTGAVTNAYTPEELLALVPEATNKAYLTASLLMNTSSEDIRFSDINKIAQHIHKKIENTDTEGIVVTLGTDTLHYVSAALNFILGTPKKPVILVGSQRSSDRPSSDGPDNLLSALTFITQTNWTGIGVCMHGPIQQNTCLIHKATRVRKNHTSRRDAFRSINDQALSIIDKETQNILSQPPKTKPSPRLELLDEDLQIGWIKTHPHMSHKDITHHKDKDAVIIEATGLGHTPIETHKENQKIYNAIKRLTQNIPVIITSQTIHGRINLNVYTNGRKLKQLGVHGHQQDIQPSTAYMKTAWLLSNHKDNFTSLYKANIAGEQSPTSKPHHYEL